MGEVNFYKRNVKILSALYLSGVASLLLQNIWQRYFSIFLGGDAKSSSLVVGIFLIGLSSGNFFFGKLAQKSSPHFNQFSYFFIEIILGIYTLFFHLFFNFFYSNNQYGFVGEFVITAGLIFPGTFLMGGTIPLAITILNTTQIDEGHSRMYGINAIGAFTGAIGGILPIYYLGLQTSTYVIACLNFVAGVTVFTIKPEKLINNFSSSNIILEDKLSKKLLYALVFFSGTAFVGLEILWIRIWGLTTGMSALVFPAVCSVCVGSIGLAGIFPGKMQNSSIHTNLFSSFFFLTLSFFAVPYLPLWISMIKVYWFFENLDIIFHFLCNWIFLGIVLGPGLFFLSRCIPIVYSNIDKNSKDYAETCGKTYGINAVGTFIGAIVVGYLMFKIFNIDEIYKLILLLLGTSVILLTFKYKRFLTFSLSLMMLFIIIPTQWNRIYHMEGLFRKVKPSNVHRAGLFSLMSPYQYGMKNLLIKDGPDLTLAINKYNATSGYSIISNGKSDSSTIGDYSTITLLGLIPYLNARTVKDIKSDGLSSLIVGLGTGVTAGVLASFEETSLIDVVEISQEIIKSREYFKSETFNLVENKKVHFHHMDAFKFLSRSTNKKYDIIVSEPTNPWTSGVENLFTPEFYSLVKESLASDGIFVQWFHLYSMNSRNLGTVINNLYKSFDQLTVYFSSTLDDIIFANIPRDKKKDFDTILKREFENTSTVIARKLNLGPVYQSLESLRVLEDSELKILASELNFYQHGLFKPQLGLKSYWSFLKKDNMDIFSDVPPYIRRIDKKLSKERADMMNSFLKDKRIESVCLRYKSERTIGYNPFCNNLNQTKKKIMDLEGISPIFAIDAYHWLRSEMGMAVSKNSILRFIKTHVILFSDSLVAGRIYQQMALDGDEEGMKLVLDSMPKDLKIDKELIDESNLVFNKVINLRKLGVNLR